MVSVIDYGMGNLRSVQNALNFIGVENRIISTPAEILNSKKLILPGVGAFDKAMLSLENKGMIEALNKSVIYSGVPILGICLGMQLLCSRSEEGKSVDGLNWIQGEVKQFIASPEFKVPQIGFNTVNFLKDHKLFENIPQKSDFYFVHSYYVKPDNEDSILATAYHGIDFATSICRENIMGTQFHPEKSQSNGLQLLKNFIAIN